MSNLLAAYSPLPGAKPESLYLECREDVKRMLEIVETVGGGAPEMKKTRTEALRTSLDAITW